MGSEIKDLSGLGEPLGKLIDAVRSATGVLYEPNRIVNEAKAKAQAELILASAEEQKSAMAARAMTRLSVQEMRKQQNIERIFGEAVKALPANVSANEVDPDWINYFFDECMNVSDADVQIAWGKILAGEVTEPGSFSRRTLSYLKTLTKDDALIFSKAANFICTDVGGHKKSYIFFEGKLAKVFQAMISVEDFLRLQDLGLLHYDADIKLTVLGKERARLKIGGEEFLFNNLSDRNQELHMIHVGGVGAELMKICDLKIPQGFLEAFRENYKNFSLEKVEK